MKTPVDLPRVKRAVARFRRFLARDVPAFRLLMVTEPDKASLQCCGVFILFYKTGKVARVGEASGMLHSRLPAYRMDRLGWFPYKWTAVIPFDARFRCLAPALERYLLDRLDPPENKFHRPKQA